MDINELKNLLSIRRWADRGLPSVDLWHTKTADRLSRKFMLSALFVLLLLLPFGMSAKVITLEQATQIAERFWNGQTSTRSVGEIRFAWDESSLSAGTRASGSNMFYVFRSSSNKGFVIVSGEDRMQPVLAYSFKDEAPDPDNLPVPMIDWLSRVIKGIEYIRDNNLSIETRSLEEVLADEPVVELQTAQWNQNEPYNSQCPMDGSQRSVTGCVPVATAIVMRYYKWPEHGTGVAQEYTTRTKGIHVSSRDLNHVYSWDNMPLTNVSVSNGADEVSELLADIGAAFQVDYTGDDQGTNGVLNLGVMLKQFGFSPNMHREVKSSYSERVWLKMLKDELSSQRPVIYRGANDEVGHVFVLDGFTKSNYFHVNWGWGGFANGYYTLLALMPDDGDGYNDGQEAFFNTIPNTSTSVGVDDMIKFRSPGIGMAPDLTFHENQYFEIDSILLCNNSAFDFTGILRGAITDSEGNIKCWATQNLEFELASECWIEWKTVGASIDRSLNQGDRLRFFCKANGTDDWILIKSSGQENCRWEVVLIDDSDLSSNTSFTFDKRNRIISLETLYGVSVSLTSQTGGEVTTGLTTEGNTVKIDMKALPVGEYTIKLQKGSDVKELKVSINSL